MSKLITVFMPTYSRGSSGHLERAIKSVLRQTYPNFELLIVDDASVDGSKELIERYVRIDRRIKHVRMPKNIGQPALTMGIAYQQSKGDYFTFVYDDCVVSDQFLAVLIDKMLKNPSLGMAYGQAYIHWRGGRKSLIGAPFDPHNMSKGNNHIPNVSVIVKREVIEQVGWYDPHFMLSRFYDWDLWCRISHHYRIGFIPEIIAEEFGASLNDSIGHTMTLMPHLILKYAKIPRNKLLKPNKIDQYDPYSLAFLDQMQWTDKEKSDVYFLLMENLVKTHHGDAMIRFAKTLRKTMPRRLLQNKIYEKNKHLDEEMRLLLESMHFFLNKKEDLMARQAAEKHKMIAELQAYVRDLQIYIQEQRKYIDYQQQYIDEQQRWIDARQGG